MDNLRDNPLKSREDIEKWAETMIGCAVNKLSPQKAWLNAGESAARYPHKVAWTEGFLRPLFGLVPLSAGRSDAGEDLWEAYREGIVHGTDPESPEYWGDLDWVKGKEGKVRVRDQRVVEMTTLGLALAMVPEKVWQPLTEEQKKNLQNWLLQINQTEFPTNNWLFFYVVVNMGLKKAGAAYSQQVMEEALDRIETSYLSDGWYSDGPTKQRDYYIPFAMHFYGLIYSKIMGDEDPERAARYKERAAQFAKDFICWFSSEGDALPYGRSLTYRFAMCAFWSALAFAEVEVYPWGVVKGIVLRNLRWWQKQPVFDPDGLLTIGYRYPNLKMAEFYNAPGSPAWAMKAFLILALKEDHPFWQAEEEPLPPLPEVSVQKHPMMILTRNKKGNNITALTSGQYARFEPSFMAAKYEKFAYSNLFGFSVPGGEYGLEQGAYDSVLALCEEDELYRVRRQCEMVDVTDEGIYSVWKPWKDVEIHTWLVPCGAWHVRVHRITGMRKLKTAEGAFAVNCDFYEKDPKTEKWLEETGKVNQNAGCAKEFYPWGGSGIVDLEGSREGVNVDAHPNSNIMYSRTKIPTLIGTAEPGETWLACAVLGAENGEAAEKEWANMPAYQRKDKTVRICWNGREIEKTFL